MNKMLDKFKDEEERDLSVVRCVHLDHKNHIDIVFVTICAWCKRVRDNGFWHKTIEFCHQDSEINFTHGICPECMRKVQLALAMGKKPTSKETYH